MIETPVVIPALDDWHSRCWWCGAEPPLTIEHCIPKQLKNLLAGDGRLTHTYSEPGATKATRQWTKVNPAIEAKVVCDKCNHDWMAKLDDRAMDYLRGPVAGVPSRLTTMQARIVARWTTKVVLMMQGAEPATDRVVDRLYYRDVFADLRQHAVPPTLRCWAGAVDSLGVHSHAFSGTLTFPRREPTDFWVGLLVVDRLALMVMGCRDTEALAGVKLGPLANAWVDTSSRRSQALWPPPFEFSVEQFGAMPRLLEECLT